jgi:hypothetical protein
MKARIKLRPLTGNPTPTTTTPAAAPAPALTLHGFGVRWVQGKSIRKLGREAGMEWNVLQGKLRILGYLRAPKRAQKGA